MLEHLRIEVVRKVTGFVNFVADFGNVYSAEIKQGLEYDLVQHDAESADHLTRRQRLEQVSELLSTQGKPTDISLVRRLLAQPPQNVPTS